MKFFLLVSKKQFKHQNHRILTQICFTNKATKNTHTNYTFKDNYFLGVYLNQPSKFQGACYHKNIHTFFTTNTALLKYSEKQYIQQLICTTVSQKVEKLVLGTDMFIFYFFFIPSRHHHMYIVHCTVNKIVSLHILKNILF